MSWRVEACDALTLLRSLDSESADAVITDPPYNVGYRYATYSDRMEPAAYFAWQREVVAESARVLKPGGSLLYLHYPEPASLLFHTVDASLTPFDMIAWTYNAHTSGTPLRKSFRLWCWWTKGEPFIDERETLGEYRNPTDVRVKRLIEAGRRPRDYDWWHYEQVKNVSTEKTEHPCQIPLSMAERVVRMVSQPGGVIVDPFAGSGTVGEAALRNGRAFVGCDLSQHYVQSVITPRLQAVSA